MNTAEKSVLKAIDFPSMYNFINELIATTSYNGHESKAQELVATKLAELGLEVDKWEINLKRPRKSADIRFIVFSTSRASC